MKTIDQSQTVQSPGVGEGNTCPACGHTERENAGSAPDRFHGRTTWYHMSRCTHCSLVVTADAPPPSEIGAHYGNSYDQSISSAGFHADHWSERCGVLNGYKPHGGALLDLGCSAGGFMTAIKAPQWKLHGIEMSEKVASVARERSGAEVFVGDILDAPYAKGSFDAITCFHVFEHMYQPREVLEKVSEWLKPGGLFFAMMPNIDSAAYKVFGSYWYALEMPRHLYHYSPKSLATMTKSVGLETASLTTRREVFFEQSVRYIVDEYCNRSGFQRTPLSEARSVSFPFRVVRKAFRLTALPLINQAIALKGDGESIHGVFRKP